MQKTLEDLAMRRGRHLTAEDARQALVQRHGKAPNVSTIRRWLKRRQDDYKDSTPDPGRPLPPGVEALGGLDQAEAPRAGDETDLIDRIIDLAKTAISPLGIELGHEDYERLVAAIRELFNEMDDEEPEDRCRTRRRSGGLTTSCLRASAGVVTRPAPSFARLTLPGRQQSGGKFAPTNSG